MGTLNTFTSGVNTSFSTELNENFALTPLVSDVDSSSSTWDEADTTYTEISSMSCGATDKNYAEITVVLKIRSYGSSVGNNADPYVEIQLGESGSESQVLEIAESGRDSAGSTDIVTNKTVSYIHELTSGEKSNGLSVIINGKYIVAGSPPGTITSTKYQAYVKYLN